MGGVCHVNVLDGRGSSLIQQFRGQRVIEDLCAYHLLFLLRRERTCLHSQYLQIQDYSRLLLLLNEMQEEIIQSCVLQTRNLFPPQPHFDIYQQESKEQIVKLKLNNQLKPALEIYKSFKDKEETKPKDKVEKKQDKIEENILEAVVKEITEVPKEQKNKIKSIQQYKQKTQNDPIKKTEGSTALVAHKLEMTMADTARLGTVKASSIRKLIKPTWHKPYKLYRVVVGHQGWVRSIAVSPCNTYFASGSNDRTIKFWDLASGKLKITLTGHINAIRGLEFSQNSPYLFSCGEDKMVKCWDLEMNKVVRSYHGHLSGVYALKLLEPLGVLVTGGRDSAARVWDIRLRTKVYTLTGHSHTVASICTQQHQPQVITGSYDTWIKTWDLTAGKCLNTLTNHKKSIRSMIIHPTQYTFASGGSDNIKVWKCPEGQFLRNISGHQGIVNSIAINPDNVLVSADNDGTMKFWDWKSGYNFQTITSVPQPGSIAAENGIFQCGFDMSGTRLITAECDKTIKFWKEDDDATEETHPIGDFKIAYDYK